MKDKRKQRTADAVREIRKNVGAFLGPKKRPGQQFRPDDDFNWNKVLKVVLSWSAIILLVFLVMTLFKGTEGTELKSHTRNIKSS